ATRGSTATRRTKASTLSPGSGRIQTSMSSPAEIVARTSEDTVTDFSRGAAGRTTAAANARAAATDARLAPDRREGIREAVPSLDRAGRREHRVLAEPRPQELHPQREPAARQAGGHGDRGQAGERRRHREHVREVHRQWVVGLLPDAERRRGNRGTGDHV